MIDIDMFVHPPQMAAVLDLTMGAGDQKLSPAEAQIGEAVEVVRSIVHDATEAQVRMLLADNGGDVEVVADLLLRQQTELEEALRVSDGTVPPYDVGDVLQVATKRFRTVDTLDQQNRVSPGCNAMRNTFPRCI